MTIAIDASNIQAGGGLTHLREILSNANPAQHGIERVIVWSRSTTLAKIEDQAWLVKKSDPMLNKSFVWSFLFQMFFLSNLLYKDNVDVLFVPGSTFLGRFRNFVTMSQNMLPFEREERSRYVNWQSRLRFYLLGVSQAFTFRRAQGMIYLTEYARTTIQSKLKLFTSFNVIPHGINLNFLQEPKVQKNIWDYSIDDPFELLYVSIITVYKHQWKVAAAVLRLREEGYPIVLSLVGSGRPECLKKVNEVLLNDTFNCITYKGLVPYEELETIYKKADGFVFASSCENQPIILLEAMTAGLPVVSSNMGPMPEVLGDAGFYFDPLDIDSIYASLKLYLLDEKQRMKNAYKSYNTSRNYTWKDCSDQTFRYLSSFTPQMKCFDSKEST
jgi:glycosyltransferase involved in cell wall biosynthesis